MPKHDRNLIVILMNPNQDESVNGILPEIQAVFIPCFDSHDITH